VCYELKQRKAGESGVGGYEEKGRTKEREVTMRMNELK
jgi:hypothetical protein